MRKLIILLVLLSSTFSSGQDLSTVEKVDAYINRLETPKKRYWLTFVTLSRNKKIGDSTRLRLYQLQYEALLEMKPEDIKSYRWKRAQCMVNQGIILEHLAAPSEEPLGKFREAFKYTKRVNLPSSQLWASIRIAKHYLNTGNLNSEEEIYHYSFVDSLVNDTLIHAETRYLGYKYLGNRHIRYNDFNVAYNYYYQAYEMAKIQNDVEQIVKLCNNLLLITERTNDTTGNQKLVAETLTLIPEDDHYYLGLYYSNLAGYDFLHDDKKKKEYLNKALKNYGKSKRKEHLITLYMLLCDYYYDLRDVDSTGYYNQKIRTTLATLPPTQLYYNDIFAEIYDGKHLNLLGDYSGAMVKLDSASTLAKRKKAFLVIPGILEIKYQIAEENGDYKTAFALLESYKLLNDSLNSIEKQTQYQNLHVKFDTEKRQKTINTLKNEKELNKKILAAQKKTNYVLWFSLGLLLLLLSVLFYLFYLNRNKSKSLQLLNNVKDKIFTVLSHDLRSPLYTFNSLLEIGKMKSLTQDEYVKYLNMIQSEVGNTTLLLESLLKWSQTNLNLINVNKQKVSVTQVLNKVEASLTQYNKNQVKIELDIEGRFYLETDEDIFRFILRNLASNALKFSPEGGTVVLKAIKENGKIVVSVKDEGVGMTAEQIKAFYHGNMEASIDAVGDKSTGLGLLLCKEFAQKLNYRIEVYSNLNQGTEFKVICS